MINEEEVLPSDLAADEARIKREISVGEETPIPNIEELGEDIELMSAWDHTGDSDHKVVGDIESALTAVSKTLSLLGDFECDPEDQDKVDHIIAFLESQQSGFKYRQERKMPSVFRQRNDIRKKLAEGDFNTAGKMLEAMAAQPDTADLVSALRDEYTQVMEIMEELLEEDGVFELDIRKLWAKVFEHNRGLDFEVSIADKLLTRYKQVAVLNKNLSALSPWAEMQDREHSIEEMEESLPAIEKAILDRVVSIITQVTRSIRMDEVTAHSDLDPRGRIEAVLVDLELEFEQAGVLMEADDIEEKLGEIDLQIEQTRSMESRPVKKRLHQITALVGKAMGQDTEELSLNDLNSKRLQLIALKKNLPVALRVIEESEIFLQQI